MVLIWFTCDLREELLNLREELFIHANVDSPYMELFKMSNVKCKIDDKIEKVTSKNFEVFLQYG